MPIVPITGTLDLDDALLPEGGLPVGGLTLGLSLRASVPNEPPVDAEFAFDTFTDTAGVLLQDHTPEKGGPWVKHPLATGDAIVSDANRCRVVSSAAYYISTTEPETADYSVFSDVHVISANSGIPGIIGRWDADALTGYRVFYNRLNGRWDLNNMNAGSLNLLGQFSQVLTLGVTYRVELRMVGESITVVIDDVERIAVTSSDVIARGHAGIYLLSPMSDTTGRHLDNFSAVNL